MEYLKREWRFITLTFFIFIIFLISYSNHFINGFHFDDSHTIVDNPYIRSIKNIPKFYTDPSTFSTLPNHQSYRPFVTTTLTLDYWFGKGLNPKYFHLSMFINYTILIVLLFFFFFKIMNISFTNEINKILVLFSISWPINILSGGWVN